MNISKKNVTIVKSNRRQPPPNGSMIIYRDYDDKHYFGKALYPEDFNGYIFAVASEPEFLKGHNITRMISTNNGWYIEVDETNWMTWCRSTDVGDYNEQACN